MREGESECGRERQIRGGKSECGRERQKETERVRGREMGIE